MFTLTELILRSTNKITPGKERELTFFIIFKIIQKAPWKDKSSKCWWYDIKFRLNKYKKYSINFFEEYETKF